jgi:hypothetical protein
MEVHMKNDRRLGSTWLPVMVLTMLLDACSGSATTGLSAADTTTQSALSVDANTAATCAATCVDCVRSGGTSCKDTASACVAQGGADGGTDGGDGPSPRGRDSRAGRGPGRGRCNHDGTISPGNVGACLDELEACAASGADASTCVDDVVACVTEAAPDGGGPVVK